MAKWDSTNIPKPAPELLLTAIEDIAFRFTLSEESNEALKTAALNRIHDMAKAAMIVAGLDKAARERWMAEWKLVRTDQNNPNYLRDPMVDQFGKFLKGLIISIKDFHPLPGDGTDFHFNFEYHCEECGGYQVEIPDDPEDHSMVTCTACQKEFGTYQALTSFCRWKANQELKRLKLGAYAEPTLTLTVHGSPP